MIAWAPVCQGADKAASPGALQFENLDESVHLAPVNPGETLAGEYRAADGRSFFLNGRLIVKADQSLSRAAIKQLTPHVQSVRNLAPLRESNIWLVNLSEGPLMGAMRNLEAAPEVAYAHPDMLQQTRDAADVSDVEPSQSPRGGGSVPPLAVRSARVAIIDDGIDFDHPAVQGLKRLFDYDVDNRYLSAGPASAFDGHGTRVAGVIARVNGATDTPASLPGVIAIRQVSTWTSDLILAFTVARKMRADVVNISWVLGFLPEPLRDTAVDWLASETPGPYIVVAAGNRGIDACRDNRMTMIPGVWTVGARSKGGGISRFSNRGGCVDLYAPDGIRMPGMAKPFGGTSASAALVSGWLVRRIGAGQFPPPSALEQRFALER